MKCEATQELVVGGFTDPQGRRVGLGALLVGYFAGRDFVVRRQGRHRTSTPRSCCRCVNGWTPCVSTGRRSPRGPACRESGAHWVKPEVVVQVAFTEWTVHGKLRHPRLLGVRIDKSAREVTRERPRDHASREGAVSGGWHHEGRAGDVLRRVAPVMVPHLRRRLDHHGALSERHRRDRGSSRRTSARASRRG